MARDPICGMAVDEASGLRAERDGQIFYFCSEHCRRTFLAQATLAREMPASGPHHRVAELEAPATGKYYCPMCAGVFSDTPGSCPKCGMSLERSPGRAAPGKVIYTCPMHPEVKQDRPGTCPICGMDLEPQHIEASQDEDDPELRAMTRRFWASVVLGLPVFLLAMLPMLGVPLDKWIGHPASLWIQFMLSTPVVLWGGWPFFQRGWRSLATWQLVHREPANCGLQRLSSGRSGIICSQQKIRNLLNQSTGKPEDRAGPRKAQSTNTVRRS